MPDFQDNIVEKSKGHADEYRNEGNLFFNVKKYVAALLCYNKSLLYSPPDSESLGLAYANRSAAYYKMELYNHSLINIQLARENKYPMQNIDKLEIREKKCLEIINDPSYSHRDTSEAVGKEFFELSYTENKKIPFIVECLELKKVLLLADT